MRAVSVNGDTIVVTSLLWQTTATAVRSGEEAMLIDSPYFAEELELLPAVLAQSGFEVNALLATHGDFDHVLGRLAFPELSLGVAESTMLRLQRAPGEAQRDLRDHDHELYVVRSRPLALGGTQSGIDRFLQPGARSVQPLPQVRTVRLAVRGDIHELRLAAQPLLGDLRHHAADLGCTQPGA